LHPRPRPSLGNILDNQELLTTLEGAKSKAVELADKLEVARATAAEIDDARVRYRPVAARGAALFFCMAGLAAINNMYEYSLAAFLGVFNQARRRRGRGARQARGWGPCHCLPGLASLCGGRSGGRPKG
jgi:dynein heavy chain, axonemal